ncbi:MAG: DsrE family protein [Burkholderiales bacterium]
MKVEVANVAFGNGIGMLKAESEVGNHIHGALESRTHVAACLNTMRGRKLQKDDMLAGLSYVEAGMVEMIEKQRKGRAVISALAELTGPQLIRLRMGALAAQPQCLSSLTCLMTST